MVIRYSYLWHSEYLRGKEEGLKDRPCAVILVTYDDDGEEIVTVLPITHTQPSNPDLAVEIPYQTKQRLGLDSDLCWIILTEVNRFRWPGPDLRIANSADNATVSYGLLPSNLFNEVKRKLHIVVNARLTNIIKRTE